MRVADCDTCGAELGPDAVCVNATRTVCAHHFRPPPPPASERELHRKLRRGDRLEFDHEPPLAEGEVYTFGAVEVTIVAIRRPKPDRWTVQTRRKVPTPPRHLRPASRLPHRSTTRIDKPATPSEIEHAREDGAYTHQADALDAGEAPSDRDMERIATAARLRHAEAIRDEIEEAA